MSRETLEDYMLSLGKLYTFIMMLSDDQKSWTRSGVLNDDEIELAETIKWHCDKLMVSMGDQVRMVGERTSKTWEETMKEIAEKLNGRED